MLICGGFNIYPAELEALLTSIDGVNEAAVIARTDPNWGEIAVAFVTLTPGSAYTVQSLTEKVRPLAGIKTPKAWRIVQELPKNPNGKLDRGILRRWDQEHVAV
jgi:acyl-CoA synthetase (AMP-forming)/AMP-acid ligase II